MMDTPVVSLYIPCHNYGGFVRAAVDSVLSQTFASWELLVVDDGSTDDSWAILRQLEGTPRVRLSRNPEALGLRAVVNAAIEAATGEFVMRLDADDLLHPRALEILVDEAARHPEAGVVFPDYFYVDTEGRVTGVECLPTVDDRYLATTFPPHGACSLIRRPLLERVGPFESDLRSQDGHELWLKLLELGTAVRHVSLPLFYYRQHGDSLSSSLRTVLADRAAIKRRLAERRARDFPIVGVLPVKNTYPDMPDVPFHGFRGSTLLDRALEAASGVPDLDAIVVTTDCARVAEHVGHRWPEVSCTLRDEDLSAPATPLADVVRALVKERGFGDDVVICLLSLHTPFRTSHHVQKAIDNFMLYDVDSVISVYEERSSMYQMGPFGLYPLNPGRENQLRREREVVYIDSGAIRVFPVANLWGPSMLGERIGHALIHAEESFQIKSPHDLATLLAVREGEGAEA